MIFIREHEQLAWDPLGLQDIEWRQALSDGESVVKLAVDNLNYICQHGPDLD